MNEESIILQSHFAGYNHEVIEFRSTIFDLWDVGGQDEVRKNWGSYFYNAQVYLLRSGTNLSNP